MPTDSRVQADHASEHDRQLEAEDYVVAVGEKAAWRDTDWGRLHRDLRFVEQLCERPEGLGRRGPWWLLTSLPR
jgi:hypothetical protein